MVTNSAGSATSANATLTVSTSATAPSITSQPASQTINVGGSATFSVTASGTGPLSYQWRFNGTNISGATSASYTLGGWTNIPATSDAFYYRLEVLWRNSSNSTIRTDIVRTYTGATGGWVQASGSYVAPMGTTNAGRLFLIPRQPAATWPPLGDPLPDPVDEPRERRALALQSCELAESNLDLVDHAFVDPVALVEDLFAMCHEQQPRSAEPFAKRGVVESRHDCLARACRGHQQITVAALHAGMDVVRHLPGTVLEAIPGTGLWGDKEKSIMADLSLAANRPLNWNLLNPKVVIKGGVVMVDKR